MNTYLNQWIFHSSKNSSATISVAVAWYKTG